MDRNESAGCVYSIYLVHYALFVSVSRFLRPLDTIPTPAALVVASVLLIPLALAVSAVFFVLVERPCMDPTWPERVRARFARMSRTSQPDQVIVIPEAVDELSDVVAR